MKWACLWSVSFGFSHALPFIWVKVQVFFEGIFTKWQIKKCVVNYKQGFKYLKKEINSTQIVVCIMDNERSSMYTF